VVPVTEDPNTQKVAEAPATEALQATEVPAVTEESQVAETVEAESETEGTESESTATAYEPVIRPAKARYYLDRYHPRRYQSVRRIGHYNWHGAWYSDPGHHDQRFNLDGCQTLLANRSPRRGADDCCSRG
jgi:hypothetical protein